MNTRMDTETARLKHVSAAEQAQRDAVHREARKNLAAIVCDWYDVRPGQSNLPAAQELAARDFQLLADMLGLERP